MDYKLSNQSIRNLPLINLPQDEVNSLKNSLLSEENKIENCFIDKDNNLIFTNDNIPENFMEKQTANKNDWKLRSNSMISDRIHERKSIDECARNRAGSMFIPNLCIHCRLLEEVDHKEIRYSTVVSNCSDEDDLTGNSIITTTTGSLISSRSSSPPDSSSRSSIGNESHSPQMTKEFGQFLQVPIWKPRASSLDSGIFHNDIGKDHGRRISFEEALNPEKPRATSVDVHFESVNAKFSNDTLDDPPKHKKKHSKGRFSIVSVSSRQTISKVIQRLKNSRFRLQSARSKYENFCSQWNENSQSREHIWYPDNSVRHRCNVFNCEDYNSFELYKCSVCKTASCFPCRIKINNTCRKTFFTEISDEVENSKLKNGIFHHWIHRTRQKGMCKSCSKSLQSQNFFLNEQSISVIQCTSCKASYHNKAACFSHSLLTEICCMGSFKALIIHPSLITKSKYSENSSDIEKSENKKFNPFEYFEVNNTIDLFSGKFLHTSCQPILALINPKSGGKEGIEVLNELQWIFNPRQVFDISLISPEQIIRFYQSINNLRFLVGGGDGTVNWILKSIETSLNTDDLPPIAVIPLGTGNDLSRELNWGSSYNSNESLSSMIGDIEYGTLINVDIWKIFVTNISPENISSLFPLSCAITPVLPVEKFNNYFSLGSDAATALEFHQNREKYPHRFNSRLKNKLCYAEIGGKDVIRREYKNLADNISLECDGVSFDSRLSQLRPHCILFLNISNYSAGTNPWGKYTQNSEFVAQSINDCLLEVIGLSAASLATIHMGGKGDRICQCNSAKIEIRKETAIQIDGEPMLILPCIINISHKQQYPFIKRNKKVNQ